MLWRATLLFGAALSIWSGAPQAAEATPQRGLTVGVAPYLSTRTLLGVYQPLQAHLHRQLATKVDVFTAADFRAFYLNAIEGDYDLAIMPAHLARLAQMEHGFVPLVRYTSGARGLVVTKAGSSIANPEGLRGQKVAVPDRLTLATILCLEWLKARNIRVDRDFQVVQTPSFNSAMYALEHDEAVAAIAAPAALAQMEPQLREKIRVVVDTGDYINLVYLAHPRVEPKARARLKDALLEFAREASGRRFFSDTGFGDFAEAAPGDLKPLDPYLAETKRLLHAAQPAR